MAPTIVIDARKILDFGIGTYIRNLILQLAEIDGHHRDGRHRYVLLVPTKEADAIGLGELPPNFSTFAESAPVYSVGELFAVSRTLRRVGADIYHATHYVLPFRPPCPSIVTIHDLIHLLFPDFLPNRRALLYARAMLRRAGKVAERVIAVSEHTAQDLVAHLGIPRSKIDVILNGVEPQFSEKPQPAEDRAVLQRHRLDPGYLLFVGNPKPHKNLQRVLEAYAQAKSQLPELVDLVCVGAGDGGRQIEKLAASLEVEQFVRVLGFVDHQHLPALYRAASMLLSPGLYEGFGLPVVEAMASGTPVITSNTSALAEVAGNAALLVDPLNTEAIAQAIGLLSRSPSAQQALITVGKARAQNFQWRIAAEQTLAIYQGVLELR